MTTTEKMRSGRRPTLSIRSTETMVTITLHTFISTATMAHWSSDKPFCLRKEVEKLNALLMPENCCNAINVSVMAIARRTAGFVAAACSTPGGLVNVGVSASTSAADSAPAPAEVLSSSAAADEERDRLVKEEVRECGPTCTSSGVTAVSMQYNSSASPSSVVSRSRSRTNCSSAMRSLPYMAYQRGDSSSIGCISICSSAMGSTIASMTGQVEKEPRIVGSPRTCAPSMPMTHVSCISVPSVPRRCAGEISPR
mmetsp:Transcript_29549/g.73876  ORF Transcript_29549/g.73876 Transcript_29549/m.73876 type:complete len:254 (-) Transcript_29549:778-1539(-)